MYLNIEEKVKKRFEQYKDAVIVLDMDDGVGRYSKIGLCSLNTHFRFLILKDGQDQSDYQSLIESNMGKIPVKEYSRMYLDDKMDLIYDDQRALTKLKGTSGMIDGNVSIVDMREN
ncbi:hypothetical protein NRIC_37890 [Enterococcus florum]|uniref:Core domain-containing protein n=1 Tax=Enterococcus florum TaxID=2480627 RepID=A0A4P5PHU3_9ENTE|nr:iron-sulfur cluster biosynthesis family protein [Enterococcus florum]GCF95898.1 hypothetical protein NRIC_37890 [Enterococcus florum]